MAAAKPIRDAAQLQERRSLLAGSRDPGQRTVRVCIGTGCAARGSRRLHELFKAASARTGRDGGRVVECKHVGCHGLCELGPIVVVGPDELFYHNVAPADVEEIWSESVLGARAVERLLYSEPGTGRRLRTPAEIPFYSVQRRIVLEHNGRIDPTSIDDYIACGGYAALATALGSMKPQQIIDVVEASGLRGRGGAGFRTGRKWRICREAPGELKYVICNGDEGDPGAFMDRSVMEGNPHAVLEGLIIGAYAIGASQGLIYVRNEYPLAVEHLTKAMSAARAYGLLGPDILASGFAFDLRMNRVGGAFVCGEETSLIASLEGRLPDPRVRPPYPAESGYLGRPTNINNVETWANIPPIIRRGADWFSSIGTPSSKGTKVFSLVGKINNTGLVEVPMGIRLRDIVFDIGGGIPKGRRFKAVQTGGPSGGCIPEEHLDAPVDFDELTRLGSMMGSGGMIVMDEDNCMVAVARYFLGFLKSESCGQCTPCREGIPQMLRILERIAGGEGEIEDLDRLEALAILVRDSSLCALGATAANPVLSTLRYFRREFEEHVRDRHCAARECRGLFRYEVDPAACTGCAVCARACPAGAITGARKKPHVIDQALCTFCNTCFEKCRFDAIRKI
jgi:NADH-quinone oxidoreductase subunit F